MRDNLIKAFLMLFAIGFVVTGGIACKSDSHNNDMLAIAGLSELLQEDSQEKNGEVKITFHDAPILNGDITAVNMNILETQLVDFDDKIHVVSTEDLSFNLLNLTENNPVLLAHAKVEPRTYKQIRLILDDRTSLTFADGSTEPLKVPSSEQSGLKIDGIFTVPEGVLYTLDIDLDPNKSIHYTKGQGYIMKPVITLTGADILQGNFAYKGSLRSQDFVYNLKSNGTFDLILSKHPDYLFSGNYKYDGIARTFDIVLTHGVCSVCVPKVNVHESDFAGVEHSVHYNVETWGADYIELETETGGAITLSSISEFALSAVRKTVIVNASLNVANSAYEGLFVVGMIYPVDGVGEAPMVLGQVNSGKANLNFHITEIELPSYSDREYRIAIAIVSSLDDVDFDANGITRVSNIIEVKPGSETQFSLGRQDSPKNLTIDL